MAEHERQPESPLDPVADSPAPLDYAGPERSRSGLDFAVGLIIGFVVTAATGFLIALLVERLAGRPWALHSTVAAAGFFATSSITFIFFFRGIHRARVGLRLGLLLGAGLMAVLEGACFMDS
jgi:hypothetical protein